MPLEILTGPEVPALLARAQKQIGADAVVLSVKRVRENGRSLFEMVAADPVTAARQRREHRPRAGADTVIAAERPAPGPVRAPDAAGTFWSLEAPAPAAAVPAPAPAPAPRPSRAAGRPAARLPRVVAVVGPTGAGKTTTLAKLANHPQAFAGRRVGFVCLDTYRIGGVEQARQYAELSRLPFEVVWESRDLPRAMRRMRDLEVVLVDTPGRGPRAAEDLRALQERLLALAPDEVHLVLPAGLQPALAHRMVAAHLPLGVTHLLVTKLDEFPDERGAFELAHRFGLPMRWVTDGQEVPRDLQPAPATPGLPLALAEAA
jgi:flagellar biosynthesis protein FlhF